eukprot:m.142443 g.142443  ORF g.142443 m.142443 type:complete len:69 (-) comp14068_c0_seq2:492-698(-)
MKNHTILTQRDLRFYVDAGTAVVCLKTPLILRKKVSETQPEQRAHSTDIHTQGPQPSAPLYARCSFIL